MEGDFLQEHGNKIMLALMGLLVAFGRWLIGREVRRVDRTLEAAVSRDELQHTINAIQTEARASYARVEESLSKIDEKFDRVHDRVDQIYRQTK